MPLVDEFCTGKLHKTEKLRLSLLGHFSILFFQIEMILEFAAAIILSLTFYTVHGIGIGIAAVSNIWFYCLRSLRRSGKY